MAAPFILPNFSAGELAPDLYGHTDLAKYHAASATCRNAFVNYKGGINSRAGTAFVGQCLQDPSSGSPPRDIPFQFSLNQSVVLEFGGGYIRFKTDGAYVLESPVAISGASQANPCQINAGSSGIASATANNGAVAASYAPGDHLTLAGGTFSAPAVLAVTNTLLVGLGINNFGVGNYAPADTIALTGGTQTTPAELTVATTRVVSATVAAGGAGGTDGTQTVIGTTGTGTPFQASVTVTGGAVTAVLSITVPGSYTVNPTTPATEPVTGASLTGAELDIVLGVDTFSISDGGVFTANASGGTFTQASSSGTGTGATFSGGLFAPNVVSIVTSGTYTVEPTNPVAVGSETGSGSGVTFNLTFSSVHSYANGDWVFISGVNGMTELNGNTYIVAGVSGPFFTLKDLNGNPVDSTHFSAYTSGGFVARLYTLSTPYEAFDLPYLKFAQSADVMSLCLVNPTNRNEYPPYDLKRFGDTNWTLTETDFGSPIAAPFNATASATNNPDPAQQEKPTSYAYVVTAVNGNGQESVASPIANVTNSVDMGLTAGSIIVNWSAVSGATSYNIYRTSPNYNTNPGDPDNALPPPVGSLFFFAGQSYGTQFVDTNTVTDSSRVPPLHKNPFARGQVLAVTITGSSRDWVSATVSMNTSTGSGFSGEVIIVGGQLVAVVVIDNGGGYAAGDTPFITGNGSFVSITADIGPQTGTYPGVVAYFQQRRFYAATLNNPDTYYASQPGAFTNMDSSNPPTDSDALSGTPWAEQVDGIQWLVSMPGGLVVFTGKRAWQLTGPGGSSLNPQPITPSGQDAQPQAFYGISATLPPIVVNYDVLYQEAAGSYVYDLNYNFFVNIYTGNDISWPSAHLFTGHQISQWALALKPYKIVWAARDDGVLLSLTYLKEQEVAGWTRHTTQGLVKGVCSVTEPPVDAVYLIVERTVDGRSHYYSERMDDRLWSNAEDPFCVDAGVRSTLSLPGATLTPSAASGNGVTFAADAAIFSSQTVGGVIRCAGGIATVTQLVDSRHVIGNWSLPMVATLPDDPNNTPIPQASGSWSIAGPFTVFSGLSHLIGKQVSVLADGVPLTGLTVSADGTVTLPFAASNVVAGLAFGVQFQTLYMDATQPTQQGRMKTVNAVTARLQGASFPLMSASNQPDGSALNPPQQAPAWTLLGSLQPTPPGAAPATYTSPGGATVTPLYTGDIRGNIQSTWRKPGQVAVQQTSPVPLNLLALIPEALDGDTPETQIKEDRGKGDPFGRFAQPQQAA